MPEGVCRRRNCIFFPTGGNDRMKCGGFREPPHFSFSPILPPTVLSSPLPPHACPRPLTIPPQRPIRFSPGLLQKAAVFPRAFSPPSSFLCAPVCRESLFPTGSFFAFCYAPGNPPPYLIFLPYRATIPIPSLYVAPARTSQVRGIPMLQHKWRTPFHIPYNERIPLLL